MVRELIDCKGERHLYEQLLEYLTEHNYARVPKPSWNAKRWNCTLTGSLTTKHGSIS